MNMLYAMQLHDPAILKPPPNLKYAMSTLKVIKRSERYSPTRRRNPPRVKNLVEDKVCVLQTRATGAECHAVDICRQGLQSCLQTSGE
jgi:hypothetical protein